MAPNYERGFYRLTIAISAIAGIIGLFFTAFASGERLVLFGMTAVAVGLIWGIYFGARWIVFGFLGKDTARPSTNEPPTTEDAPVARPAISQPASIASRRASFWKSMWPDIKTDEAALTAIKNGAMAGYIVAGLTAAISMLAISGTSVAGMSGWSMIDAVLIGLLAYGMSRVSRVSASLLCALYLFGQIAGMVGGSYKFGIMQLFIFLWMASGARGVFYIHRDAPLKFSPLKTKWARPVLRASGLILGLAVLLCGELYAEYKLEKHFLINGLHRLVTARVESELIPPAGDYAFKFSGLKREWRLTPRFMMQEPGASPAFFATTSPGGIFSIHEESGNVSGLSDKQLVAALINSETGKSHEYTSYEEIPGAVDGKIFIFRNAKPLEDDSLFVSAAYRASPTKMVLLRFVVMKAPKVAPEIGSDILHDIELISRGFQAQPRAG